MQGKLLTKGFWLGNADLGKLTLYRKGLFLVKFLLGSFLKILCLLTPRDPPKDCLVVKVLPSNVRDPVSALPDSSIWRLISLFWGEVRGHVVKKIVMSLPCPFVEQEMS